MKKWVTEMILHSNSITFSGNTKSEVYRKIEDFDEEYNVHPVHLKFDLDYYDKFGIFKAYVKFEANR